MWLMTVFVGVCILVTALSDEATTIRVGLMFPYDVNKLTTKNIAFATTAGAIRVALDRIESERLLPNVNRT